jgi:hypothetical protein
MAMMTIVGRVLDLSLFFCHLLAKSDGKHEREGGKKQRCATERKNCQVKKR